MENILELQKMLPDGWLIKENYYDKNKMDFVSPDGTIYDLVGDNQLKSRWDGSIINPLDLSMQAIYSEYQRVKATALEHVLLYGVDKELYIIGADGIRASHELGIDCDYRLIDGEKIPVLSIPYDKLKIYSEMLADRGWNLMTSELYEIGGSERYSREIHGQLNPKASWPVGRIDFLGYNGKVSESIEYLSGKFELKIGDLLDLGQPIRITRYTDNNGVPMAKGPYHAEIKSPYIENMQKAEMAKSKSSIKSKLHEMRPQPDKGQSVKFKEIER